MSSKLQIRIDALTGMRNAIESIYDNNQLSPSNPFQSCCEVDLQEKSTLLNIEVVFVTVWYHIGPNLIIPRSLCSMKTTSLLYNNYTMSLLCHT